MVSLTQYTSRARRGSDNSDDWDDIPVATLVREKDSHRRTTPTSPPRKPRGYPASSTFTASSSSSFPSADSRFCMDAYPLRPLRPSVVRRRNGQPSIARRPRLPHREGDVRNTDIIDSLDTVGLGAYHHEGPYDAASLASNRSSDRSPMAALTSESSSSTSDSRPSSSGVASLPPGMCDRDGRFASEDSGTNVLVDYLSVPAQNFTDNDFENDPFYTDPYPKVIEDFRRGLRKWARRLFRRRRVDI